MIVFDLLFGWLAKLTGPDTAGPGSASIAIGPTITAQVILTMGCLKRGTHNPITIVYKNADDTARTGKTVKFFLVDANEAAPETAPKIGSETMYSTTEREETPGTYDGVFPMADSLKLQVQPGRKYRVVPYEEGEFVGDDQSFTVQFA